jgi:hypothetical protein
VILTSRRQRRVLAEIRQALRHSDPRLVARFTIFTRLTEDEEIPQVERVRAAPLRWAAALVRRVRPGRWRARSRRGRAGRGEPGILRQHLGAVVLIPAAAAVLISVLLVLGRTPPTPACAPGVGSHLRTGQQAFVPRSFTVPSCRPASIGRVSAGER